MLSSLFIVCRWLCGVFAGNLLQFTYITSLIPSYFIGMDEDDPKEYRWETGYEKTWYVILKMIVPSMLFEIFETWVKNVYPFGLGRRLKKTMMGFWRLRLPLLFYGQRGGDRLRKKATPNLAWWDIYFSFWIVLSPCLVKIWSLHGCFAP